MRKAVSVFQTLSMLLGFLVVVLFLIPMVAGFKPYIVVSGSMEPTIHVGSVAYVNTHVKPEEIKEGDIIGFSLSDNQVTHRVKSVNDDKTFTTKGDANEVEDQGRVKFTAYTGKTVFSIPYIGKIVAQTKTKAGVFAITVIVGFNIFFIIFDDFIFGKEDKKRKLKKLENDFSRLDEIFDEEESTYIRSIVHKEIKLMKNEIINDMLEAEKNTNINKNILGGENNEK